MLLSVLLKLVAECANAQFCSDKTKETLRLKIEGGFMKKDPVPTVAGSGGSSKLHNTLVYIRQHWQLYLIFMLPAFALTIIFRYIPMGGVAIAFLDYNPFRGILGSEYPPCQSRVATV